jgi:hypothetical protein
VSYQYTDVLVYGVAVSCEEAQALLVELGAAAFEAQRAVDFEGIKREWKVTSWELELAHCDLAAGSTADVYPCATFSNLAGFYDRLGFLPFLAPATDIETITWADQRGRSHGRTRYHIDLVCEGSDARRDDSRRYLGGHESYFGVVLGSHGYGYTDDLRHLAAHDDPRIASNFERYARPALVARGWERQPALHTVGQIW